MTSGVSALPAVPQTRANGRSKTAQLVLKVLLGVLALYELNLFCANLLYTYSQTSRELHRVTRPFDSRAWFLDGALLLAPNWRMYRSKGVLYLEEAISLKDSDKIEDMDSLLEVSIQALTTASRMEPREAGNYYDIGRALLLIDYPTMRRHRDAIGYFRKAMELDPVDETKLENLSRLLIGLYPTLTIEERRFTQEIVGRAVVRLPKKRQSLITQWRKSVGDPAVLEPFVSDEAARRELRDAGTKAQ